MMDSQVLTLSLFFFLLLVFGIFAFFEFRRLKEFKALLDVYKDENTRLRADVDKQSKEIDKLKKALLEEKHESNILLSRLSTLESSHLSLPIPQWLKDTNGIMISVNDAYEKEFLLPFGKTKADYLGKTDFDVWPEEVAEAFVSNDRLVYHSKGFWVGVEPIRHENEDLTRYWQIMKYVRRDNGIIVGIGGLAMPRDIEDLSEVIGNEDIYKLIKKGKIVKALEYLERIATEDYEHEVLGLFSRYNKLQDATNEGTLDQSEIDLEFNKIIRGITHTHQRIRED